MVRRPQSHFRASCLFSSCHHNHQERALQCGGDVRLRRRCSRSYFANGHWETRLQLEVPVNETESEIHWAYAPYLSTLKHGAGPLVSTLFPHKENAFMD